MKAAHWVAAGRVVCEEAPVPSPADGELLVRTAYASICGSDLHSVYGGPPPDPTDDTTDCTLGSRLAISASDTVSDALMSCLPGAPKSSPSPPPA